MIASRFKFFFIALLAASLLTAGGQELRTSALGNEALARQRSARFLAERGIVSTSGIPPRYSRSPAEMLAQARARFRRRVALVSHAVTSVPVWQPVGPAQVFTSTYGYVAGRVTSIAADPSDPTGNTVYLGTSAGGVWKSTNAAAVDPSTVTFVPLTDSVYLALSQAISSPSLSIGAISVQPVVPGASPVILAGTGVANDTTASYFGSGILRSADGGSHWTLISQSSDETEGALANFTFTGNGFAGFAWGTVSGSPVVVAAVSQAEQGVETDAGAVQQSILGIYYSTDLGQTWFMATISDPGGLVQSNQTDFVPCDSTDRLPCGNAVTSVVWNPVRKEFFAAVRYHGYYVSSDGQNWNRLTSQPGANLTTAMCPFNHQYSGSQACPIFNGVLAVQPVTGDTFALTTDGNNLDQGLWQDSCQLASGSCSSSTLSFNQISDSALDCGTTNAPNCASGNAQPTLIPQADYDLYLAAVPYQGDTLLYAGTADIYRCDLGQGCAWRNTTHAQSYDCNSAHVAPAQYAIDATFGANGLLYFGNDGGIWRTTDAVNQTQPECSSDDASHFQNLNLGFTGSIAEVEDLAPDTTDPQTMMASLGPLGTAAPLAGSASWQQVLNGEGDFAAIDPSNPQNWYATSEFGIGINLCTQGSACGISGFGSPIVDSADVGDDGYGQIIPAPWILDPQNSDNLILGTCRVWWGTANGGALTAVSNMLDSNNGSYCNGNAEIRSIAASGGAGGTPERIYAGMAGLFDGGATEAGQVFEQTVTNGVPASTQWIDLSNNINNFNPDGFDISSIYVDPHSANGQTVYATLQGFGALHVYQTTDGGNDWQDISSDLPGAPANSVVVDPDNANTVYVATDAGVYYTQNVARCAQRYSACWSPLGSSLPNAPVTQISAVSTSSGPALLAATYGRGVWQINLPTVATATGTASPASLTFSDQAVRTTSAQQQVLITNTGSTPLQVSSLSVAGDFTETDTCAGQSISSGSSCMIEVSFAPAQTGAESGTLTLYANVAGGQLVISLSGTGVPGAAVTLTPTALCFQATLVGQTTSSSCQSGGTPSQPGSGPIQAGQSIVIANTGGVAASLTSVSITSGITDFKMVADTCGASLAAANNVGDSCTVSITFTPAASGTRSGTLSVTGNVGTQTAQLIGTGESQATDTLSPSTLSFGSEPVGTPASAAQQLTVTMTNTGDEAVQDITLQSSVSDFSFANDCGATLAGHSSCAIVVNFLPTSIGLRSGLLSVSDTIAQGASALSHTQQVTLSGTGTAPAGAASAAPLSINFGYYAVGSSDPNSYNVTVTNNGSSSITGMQSAITGDFSIQAAQQSPCGTTLAVGASCNIAVVFAPTQANQRAGSLTVSGANLNPLAVALSGNGAAFQITGPATALVSGGQTSASFPLSIESVNGSAGPVSLTCSVAPATATCAIPASVTLTGLNTQSATLDFTVSPQSRLTKFNWNAAGFALAMLFPLGFVSKGRRKWLVPVICFAALILAPVGCGVSSSSGSNGSSPGGGGGTTTAAGTYTVTVTATMPANTQSGATVPGLTNTATTIVTVD